MWTCKKCNKLRFSSETECKCRSFIITDEDGEVHEIFSAGVQDAAEKFAQKYNENNDYCLMNETMNITIKDICFDEIIKYTVGAEPDIYYFANEEKES